MATASDKFIVVGRGIAAWCSGHILTYAPEASGINCRTGGKRQSFQYLGFDHAEETKGRPDQIGTPWNSTVAPVRSNRKMLERVAQVEANAARVLERNACRTIEARQSPRGAPLRSYGLSRFV